MSIIVYFSATWHKYGETSAYVYKKKAIESHRVSSKNLQLMCYPKCMHAYQIWIALFFQLNEKQQNYHLDFTFKQNIDIPLLTTDKPDHYFFSSHFSWIYAYYYNKNKTQFKFKAYEKNNSYESIIQALNEVRSLLSSGLHHSIQGLDIIAYWLNEQYRPDHLQEVFGHKILTINQLRELSGLSKSQSPVSSFSDYAGPISLEKILVGISS
ncbi:hypothetical protein ABFP25_11725 [Acinetobacter indicus]|uniref:hypothetical protein n=1 Tax=Acinetobacter indicus TaxID=756892 RepID=UPI0032156140